MTGDVLDAAHIAYVLTLPGNGGSVERFPPVLLAKVAARIKYANEFFRAMAEVTGDALMLFDD
jgi:hypothetical protein